MRSSWKIPLMPHCFLRPFLMLLRSETYFVKKKKIEKLYIKPISKISPIYVKRNFTIPKTLINYKLKVHNGKNWLKLLITSSMIGSKFGDFGQTKILGAKSHKKKKKKEKKKKKK